MTPVRRYNGEYPTTAGWTCQWVRRLSVNISFERAGERTACYNGILLVYPFLQKYFTKGVYVGAVKG